VPDELIVIGLTGRARAGKDTAAQALCLHRGFTRLSLGDGVRSAFNELSGPSCEFHKELTPEHNYRRALQKLGAESRFATYNSRLWCSYLLAKIHYAWKVHPVSRNRFVVPDVRFPLEVAALLAGTKRWGGKFALVEVTRPASARIAESDHPSETAMEESGILPDSTLINSGDIDHLVAEAVSTATALLHLPPAYLNLAVLRKAHDEAGTVDAAAGEFPF
jgi:hypothetical protein